MTPGQEMGSPSTWLPDATLNINGEAFLNGGNLTLSRLLFAADVNLNIADRLLVQGDGEFRIQDSAQVDADYLHVGGTTGGGMLIVEDAGSSLDILGATDNHIGLLGFSGQMIVQDDATASFNASLNIANSSDSSSAGILDVLSGGEVTVSNHVNVGTGTQSFQSATLTVSDADSLFTQTGTGDLNIGGVVPGNTAQVLVSSSGVLSTGTGDTTINTTGRLTIGNGTFNANGDITMAGGILERISTIGDFNLGTGLTLTAELDAQVGFLGSYAIDDNTAFEIRSGADLIATTLDIGKTTDGTLTVKNTGSTASFGDVSLGNDNASSSTAALSIDDFAVVTTGNLSVATTAAAGTSATVTVDGSSELTLVGSQPLPHDQTYVPGVAPSDAIVWPDHVLVAERDPDM
jgi:hypothetical protein